MVGGCASSLGATSKKGRMPSLGNSDQWPDIGSSAAAMKMLCGCGFYHDDLDTHEM
jgi:hypothetical protein